MNVMLRGVTDVMVSGGGGGVAECDGEGKRGSG